MSIENKEFKMICPKCNNECFAVDNEGKVVSSCCLAEPISDYNMPGYIGLATAELISEKTLHDDVAIACLQSMIAKKAFENGIYSNDNQIKALMIICFEYADAYMLEREKHGNKPKGS
jgi:hypothetical protein